MPSLLLDVHHAVRLVRRQPAFSIVAIVMLAAGIGAATAVFALVQAVLLRELPFAEPDRLAWMYNARTERDRAPLSIPDLEDYRRDNATLSGMAMFINWTANLTGTGDAERLEGTRVSGGFFRLLGAQPLIGRTLDPADEDASARVAVLTHALWMRRFGGDPAQVGRGVLLNGAAYTVVGVMPPGFVFPFRDADIAVPLSLRDDPRRADRGANFLRVVARLKRGVSLAQARSDLNAVARRLQRAYPDDDARKTGVSLYPLHDEIVGDYRQILWTLFGAVSLLVAVGCGNLANLLIARTSGRSAECGLRVSLGASPRRLIRQLSIEAAVLAIAGAGAGIGVAAAALDAWRVFGPANFPRLATVAIDGRVLGFAAALCAIVVVLCGVIPGWIAARDIAGALRKGTRTGTSSRRDGRMRRGFVMAQIGGATVLLVTMGLVAHGFSRLERVDPGFTPDHAVSVQLSLPPARYAGRDAILVLYESLRERFAAVSGVHYAGAVSLLPLSGLLNTIDIALPDRPAPPPDEVPQAHFRIASPGYFAAAGVSLIDGREFAERDNGRGKPVVVISRTLAERHWPGQPAVGRYVRIPQFTGSPSFEVIGVANDVKQFTMEGAPTADLYISLAQMPASQAASIAARIYWVLRTDRDPRELVSDVRQAIHATDADIATSSVRTLDEILARALSSRRAIVQLLAIFGQVAFLLAVIGVYAIAAFSAATRRRELAIRAAFGAEDGDLIRLVVAAEYRPICLGIAVGLVCARLVAGLLGGVLVAVSPSDPTTYALVAVALGLLTFVATLLPAVRAGHADPAELLRA